MRISRDLLGTKHRERRRLELGLGTRQPFVVDKVDLTAADRDPYVIAVRDVGFRVAAYLLDTAVRQAIARNDRRTGRARVPVPAILGPAQRLEPPTFVEGFEAVHRIPLARAG